MTTTGPLQRSTETPSRSGGRTPRRRRARGTGGLRNASPGRGPLILAVLLAIILCVAGVVWGYRLFTARIEAVKRIDAATALIEDADAVVVQVDSVIREKVTPELADAARQASGRIPQARTDLTRAVRLLDEARPLSTSADRTRVDLLTRAAEARIGMLGEAGVLLALNVAASDSMPVARGAWDDVIAADRLSDKAVVAYNKLTKAGVKASRTYNKQAALKLAAARTKLTEADRSFSEAPFEQFIAYVDARIRLNGLSQKSDSAWLKGNVKSANSVAKTYNTEDKQAIALAKQLPASPDQAIADAYEGAAKAATDAYYAAREAATKADASLRSP